MRAIFISYRRDDSEGYAGRLLEDLCERFGKDSVFMDVAGIEPGRDFRRVIEQQVASCGVLLAVIGKSWLTVADAQGRPRLDDPYDFVRLETASALKRDIPVIPVLVQQANMPRAEQLPDDLKDLAFRNSVELTHARWGSDVQLLITALMPYVDSSEPTSAAAPPLVSKAAPASARPAWLIAPLATLAVGGIGYVAWNRLMPTAEAPTSTAGVTDRMAAASAATRALAAASSTPFVEAPSPAPVPVDMGTLPKRAVDKPAAPQPASTRRLDRSVIVRTPASAPAPAPATSTPVPPSLAYTSPPAPALPGPALSDLPSPETAAGRRDPGLELLGSPGSVPMVTRTIVIKPDTSFVNVTGGEVIRFEVGSRSFVWNFNGQRSSFDLARVAPPSVLDHKVTAYVAPNPMYPRRH